MEVCVHAHPSHHLRRHRSFLLQLESLRSWRRGGGGSLRATAAVSRWGTFGRRKMTVAFQFTGREGSQICTQFTPAVRKNRDCVRRDYVDSLGRILVHAMGRLGRHREVLVGRIYCLFTSHIRPGGAISRLLRDAMRPARAGHPNRLAHYEDYVYYVNLFLFLVSKYFKIVWILEKV
jgi:hypothetical protein